MIPNYEVRHSKDIKPIIKDILLDVETGSDTIPFDAKKMGRYFNFVTSLRVRDREKRGEDYYINVPMVNCK